jgi:BTB/POZ domain-containing protein 9
LLGLANKYDFNTLQQSIITYVKATLTVSNVCIIYNVASFYQLKDLAESCSTFVDMHAPEVMKADGFLCLSQTALTELIARDSFFAPETEIYEGVKCWMEHSGVKKEDAGDLLFGIRLQLIPQAFLLDEIRHCGMFDPDKILDALSLISHKSSSELGHRGLLSKGGGGAGHICRTHRESPD